MTGARTAYSSDFFVVLLNRGNRRFAQKRIPLLPGPRDVAVADFDRDGKLDVAFTIYSCSLVQVFRGNGRGGFKEMQHFHTQGHIPYHLKAADIDRDGRVDLVVGNRGRSDDAVVYHNDGSSFRCIGVFPTDTR